MSDSDYLWAMVALICGVALGGFAADQIAMGKWINGGMLTAVSFWHIMRSVLLSVRRFQ